MTSQHYQWQLNATIPVGRMVVDSAVRLLFFKIVFAIIIVSLIKRNGTKLMLRDDFCNALETLSKVTSSYESKTKDKAIIVGGAATCLYTIGRFHSGDFDLVLNNDSMFDSVMEEYGYIKENRKGFLRVGWYHPDHKNYGYQTVTGPLFDGNSDNTKLWRFDLPNGCSIWLPSPEDIIADRLAQHEVSSVTDQSRLLQAREVFQCMKRHVDLDYLRQRISFESGNMSLLGTDGIKYREPSSRYMKLSDHIDEVSLMREKAGIIETEESVDAMRNKGTNRTPEKKALLKAIRDRSKDDDGSVISYF